MTGEDLVCCRSITGQVMSIKSPFHVLMNGLVKALSDVGQKISLIIYLFAEKATMVFVLPDGSTPAIIIPWQGFDQMGCFRGSFRCERILKVYIMREVLNPLTPVPPLTALDEPWPFFHFWSHHFWPKNWHHRYSTSAGGKELSKDAQIRVIGPREPQKCTKMLKQLSKESDQNFLPLHLAAPC